MTITEIGYLLGFSNPAHFTHHFRRKTGFTPSEMRWKSESTEKL